LAVKLFKKEAQRKSSADKIARQVACRVAGCVFLLMMFPYAIKTLRDPKLARDKLYASNADSVTMMTIASGYFLYDVFICLARFGENGLEFFIHAFLCSLAYGYPILTGHLHRAGAGFLMWESSTPFLYLRWAMLKLGLGDTKWMKLANAGFILAFFGCRVVYGPIMSWDFWKTTQRELQRPTPNGIPKGVIFAYYTAMLVLNTLNYFWFAKMMKLALNKEQRDRHQKAE
jgi:hypothetical protein